MRTALAGLLGRRIDMRRDGVVHFLTYGDSHAAFSGNNSVSVWAQLRLGRLIDRAVYGVGGATSSVMVRSQHLDAMRASAATRVVIMVGTNDIQLSDQTDSVTDIAVVQANIQTIIAAVKAARKRPIISTVPPRSSSQMRLTNAQVTRLLALNAWIRSTYASDPTVDVMDPWDDVIEVLPSPVVSGADDELWYRPGYAVTSVTTSSGGTGYDPTSYITVTHNGGQGCVLDPVIVGGVLMGVIVRYAGYGYSTATPPTAVLTDPTASGSGAVIALTITAGIVGWTISTGGSGYVKPLRITIADMPGARAAFGYTLSGGAIASVYVGNGNVDNGRGALWDSIAVGGEVPLTITGGGGTGAQVYAIIGADGLISGTRIANGGSGYTAGAALTATQAGATAHSTRLTVDDAGVITGALVTSPGFGYTSAPTASITTGSDAVLTPIMGSPRMWRVGLISGDTHEGAGAAYYQAGKLVPLLPAAASAYRQGNVSGNKLAADFAGTGGTLATGMTGSVADGWVWTRTAGTATGVVASKGASSQQIALSPPTKTGGATCTWTGTRTVLLSDAGWAAGDQVVASIQMAIAAMYGLTHISLAISDAQGGTVSQTVTFAGNGAQGGPLNVPITAPFRTDPLTIGASNPAVDRVIVTVTISGAATAAAGVGFDVTMTDACARKIN